MLTTTNDDGQINQKGKKLQKGNVGHNECAILM